MTVVNDYEIIIRSRGMRQILALQGTSVVTTHGEK